MRKVALVEIKKPVALAVDGLAQNFFRCDPFGVDISRVEQVNARIQTNVSTIRFASSTLVSPHALKNCCCAAKRAGAKAKRGHLQS